MDRVRKTLILLVLVGVPASAQTFWPGPQSVGLQGPCFTAGTSTFQVSPTAVAPDFRIKIDGQTTRPDLRMQLVDSPETADFVLVDDFAGIEGNACNGSSAVKTIKVDSQESAPDLTISLSSQGTDADYKIYVHSARFSHQDAAALFAVLWKLSNRQVAARY
ncbi:MAG: hypothetical protein QOJ96_3124 [Alphaproteobacteria bacterium]|jgi:hypothetical protein|nr:hypothetical protein [Alphaproteobacteria bacterium]